MVFSRKNGPQFRGPRIRGASSGALFGSPTPDSQSLIRGSIRVRPPDSKTALGFGAASATWNKAPDEALRIRGSAARTRGPRLSRSIRLQFKAHQILFVLDVQPAAGDR